MTMRSDVMPGASRQHRHRLAAFEQRFQLGGAVRVGVLGETRR
jgi:hypothetical protein